MSVDRILARLSLDRILARYLRDRLPPFNEQRAREFVQIIGERNRKSRPFIASGALAGALDQHSAPDHPLADRTPLTDPDHEVVGREFGGHDHQDPEWRGKRWFCASHDASGFWMYATDGSGHWTNVSEAAINRSFHEISVIDGRLLCSWFRGPVPPYVGVPNVVRHPKTVVTA